jgi:spore coat protein U domain-containing protein, fimbrial subunit CupE1/2/3/6
MKTACLAAVLMLWALSGRAEAACTISTTPVSFGTYNVFNASATTSTGTVTYRCGNADHNITITISTGSSGTFANRTMKKGAEVLTYNLYMDAAFANVWGDGSGTTTTYHLGNPPNGTDVNLTVYGRVAALQDVSAGSYSDTVIATINF